MKTKRICYACDLKNDPSLIAEYKIWHREGSVWPGVEDNMRKNGIREMQIFLTGNRLFMITEVEEGIVPDEGGKGQKTNQQAEEWERLMWKYQQAIPWARPGEKWVRMDKIYHFKDF